MSQCCECMYIHMHVHMRTCTCTSQIHTDLIYLCRGCQQERRWKMAFVSSTVWCQTRRAFPAARSSTLRSRTFVPYATVVLVGRAYLTGKRRRFSRHARSASVFFVGTPSERCLLNLRRECLPPPAAENSPHTIVDLAGPLRKAPMASSIGRWPSLPSGIPSALTHESLRTQQALCL